jgi:hypothetical protein
MKKALFILLLLLIIGGTIFYFGWIQIKIPEHHYGVVFTKTGGYWNEVLEPGTFYWSVEKLLPTNMKLHLFDCRPVNRTVRVESSFPSADMYASVLDEPVSFTSQLTCSLSYTVDARQLPRLVEEEGLLPDTFHEWFSVNEGLISEALFEMVKQGDSSSLQTDLTGKLGRRFPNFIFHSCSITSSSMADRDLYEAAKKIYLDRLRSEQMRQQEAENAVQEWLIPRKEKLAILEEYGRILSAYPSLLKLLIDSGEGATIGLPGLGELLNNDR